MKLEMNSDLEKAEGPSKRRRKICRTTWLTEKPSVNKLQCRTSVNIVTQKLSTVGCARRAKTELDPFSLLFSDEMIKMIVLFTNKIMKRNRNVKSMTDTGCTEDANSSEVKCFLGLLLFRCVYHDTKQSVKDLSYRI